MSVGVNITPRAVTASTIKELERKMALISAKRGTYIKFHSISKDQSSGKWVAWYDTEHQQNFKRKE